MSSFENSTVRTQLKTVPYMYGLANKCAGRIDDEFVDQLMTYCGSFDTNNDGLIDRSEFPALWNTLSSNTALTRGGRSRSSSRGVTHQKDAGEIRGDRVPRKRKESRFCEAKQCTVHHVK